MQEKYNVGIYCRLSRDDERTGESVSIENQKIMLSRYVQEQGWNLYASYCDDGVSGTTFDRPMFNQMIADAKVGKINLILCKDLSRLGRDYIEAGRFTDIVFPSMGCRFIALNDGVDTIHKNNEMLVILKNVMNEMHARQTSKKVKAALRTRCMNGVHWGAHTPLGYRKDPEQKGHLIVDPETKWIVEKIFDLAAHGMGASKIARTLFAEQVPTPGWLHYSRDGTYAKFYRDAPEEKRYEWNVPTVKKILRDELYIGNKRMVRRRYLQDCLSARTADGR